MRTQPCEVTVVLERRGARGGGGRAVAERVEIAARLAPDGARAFRVDGRARSAAHVRALLRAGGVALGDATLIRQAQVTALADGNCERRVRWEMSCACPMHAQIETG